MATLGKGQKSHDAIWNDLVDENTVPCLISPSFCWMMLSTAVTVFFLLHLLQILKKEDLRASAESGKDDGMSVQRERILKILMAMCFNYNMFLTCNHPLYSFESSSNLTVCWLSKISLVFEWQFI